MNDHDLGPRPDPVVEEGEPNPGGADAIVDDTDDDGLSRDLDPAANPAVDDVLPEQVSEPDQKSQAPEGGAADADPGTEGGPVEPPA